MKCPQANRFDRLPPLIARALLAGFVLLMLYGVLVRRQVEWDVNPDRDFAGTDVAMYQKIVERMHAGEGYYQATGGELQDRGYPLRPFLAWRLPTLAQLLALLPDARSRRMIILALAGAGLVLWTRQLAGIRPAWLQAVGGLLLLFPFGLAAMDPFHLHHESWAGVCIALSLVTHARGWWPASVGFGAAALFLRELALPFVAVMLAVAWWQRRRTEVVAWLAVTAAFAVFLAVHIGKVTAHLPPMDDGLRQSWFHLGGWPFVLRTARFNFLLLLSPPWVTAIALPLALVGLGSWSGPIGLRVGLTVGVYLLSFLGVGRGNNIYWGLMYAPLLPLGWLLAPRALVGLVRSVRRPTQHEPARLS